MEKMGTQIREQGIKLTSQKPLMCQVLSTQYIVLKRTHIYKQLKSKVNSVSRCTVVKEGIVAG